MPLIPEPTLVEGAQALKSLLGEQGAKNAAAFAFLAQLEALLDNGLNTEFKRVNVTDLGSTYCVLRTPGLDGHVVEVAYGNSAPEALKAVEAKARARGAL